MVHPPPRLIRRTLTVTAMLWAGFHLALAMLKNPLPGPAAAVPLVILTAVAALVDLRRNRELLFHANLGVSPAPVALVSVVAAATLEAIFQIVVHVAGVR